MTRERFIFTLDEGEAVLECPGTMSSEDVSDFEQWVALLLRGARRRAENKARLSDIAGESEAPHDA